MFLHQAADADREQTPRPSHARRHVRPPSPKKSRRKKSDSVLDRLQKPFQVHPLTYADSSKQLCADVLPLYRKIMVFKDREGIIPHEVRNQVLQLGLVRDKAGYFREPNPLRGTDEEARREFAQLTKVLAQAGQSQAHSRSESAWNNLVHTPVLDIVFGADILDRHGSVQVVDSAKIHVRYEPVMTASIAGDSIPFLKGKAGQLSEPACSYSLESQLFGSSVLSGQSDVSVSMVRSSGAKVDYVLAMDCREDSRLRKTIFELVNRDEDQLPHVNQTAYRPLRYSPIAVPIEAKITTSATDPLIQLGIWTVAWYQRMYDLREARVGAGPKPRLVSVPLLQVVGHQWQAYFCCDAGTSLQVYGPVSIGSTEDVVSLYVLLSSLAAIKAWIADTFHASIEAWFLCDDVSEGQEGEQEDASQP